MLILEPERKDVENIKPGSTLSNDQLADKRFDFQFVNPPSHAATFRKRAASGLQSGRSFVLPDAHEQVHEKTDLELVARLVIKRDKS